MFLRLEKLSTKSWKSHQWWALVWDRLTNSHRQLTNDVDV